MNIFFRVDASFEIGSGHIMRCLTLATFLKEKEAKVTFICAELKGNMIEYLKNLDIDVIGIPPNVSLEDDAFYTVKVLTDKNIDLLIVDHYGLEMKWEKYIKDAFNCISIMVIDDLANRSHDCEILLDQNYQKNYTKRYDSLVPLKCKKLLGPKYLLLRPEFYIDDVIREKYIINNILIFYGGSDPTNETEKALSALSQLTLKNINIHVVVGLSNEKKELIKNECLKRKYFYYEQIDYLAELMRKSDLSLGAGGITMWERCYLGLPSIVTIVAENQKESTEAAGNYGAIWNLGWHKGVKVSELVDKIKRAIEQPEVLREMSLKSRILMKSDFEFGIHPVVEAIQEVINS